MEGRGSLMQYVRWAVTGTLGALVAVFAVAVLLVILATLSSNPNIEASPILLIFVFLGSPEVVAASLAGALLGGLLGGWAQAGLSGKPGWAGAAFGGIIGAAVALVVGLTTLGYM